MSLLDTPRKDRDASRAVIACDGKGHGVVVWWVGEDLYGEIQEAGLRDLGDLGLDDAPVGISVWEGLYVAHRVGRYDNDEYETSPRGSFRAPTDAEWTMIRAGTSPVACEPWATP